MYFTKKLNGLEKLEGAGVKRKQIIHKIFFFF
jgi:hypothetical protein